MVYYGTIFNEYLETRASASVKECPHSLPKKNTCIGFFILFDTLSFIPPEKSHPIAYFITFRTYASWLHGDHRDSVDPRHNIFLAPRIIPNPNFEEKMKSNCHENSFLMNAEQREKALDAIINTCRYNHWHLYAAQIRTNHVHIVMQTDRSPDRATTSIKAYATQYLRKIVPQSSREKYWARGQSIKHLFNSMQVFRTMKYVIEEQGEEMAVYYDKYFYNAIE